MSVTIHGFGVAVETYGEGQPLQTYGTRSRGRYAITTKIQARDNVQFQVRITLLKEPEKYDNAPVEQYDADMSGADLDLSAMRRSRPFEYVAALRMGNECLCQEILWTDPREGEFKSSGYVLDGRWRMIPGGPEDNFEPIIVSDRLVMRENGIGYLFAQLDLDEKDAEMNHDTDVAELTELAENLAREKRPLEHHEIRVEIARRVLLNNAGSGSCWARPESEGVGGQDGTHHVTFSQSGSTEFTTKFVKTKLWRDDEEFFCYASIHYTHLAKLVKLGLASPDGRPKTQLDAILESIGESKPSTTPVKRRIEEIDSESDSQSSTDSNSDSDSDAPRKRRRAIAFSKDQSKLRERKTELVRTPKPAPKKTLNARPQQLLEFVPNQSAFAFRSEFTENVGQVVKREKDQEEQDERL